jgi:hypothetical protein
MRNLRPLRDTMSAARACLTGMALFGSLSFAVTGDAEQLYDPALPTVSSESLHQLSDSRTRQQIMADRQSHFPGRASVATRQPIYRGDLAKDVMRL